MQLVKKILLIFSVGFVALTLGGCDKYGTYLNREDATGASVTYPLDGILASAVGSDDVIWSEPDTNKTIDAVFDDNASSTEPSYRYFQYAKGIPIATYNIGEGVNIAIDGTYKGGDSVDGDTNPLPMVVPIEKISLRSFDKSRWSSDPEIYTLGATYLQTTIGPLFDISATDPTVPSIIFVLYQPSQYWNEDASSRKYDSTPMYFDAYYSVDYWNIINDSTGTISAPDITKTYVTDASLTSPAEFGVCEFSQNNTATTASISILSTGVSTSVDSPKILVRNLIGQCVEEPAPGLVNPTPADDADIVFTLFDAMDLEGNDTDITQEKVNKWTKYDFLEMLKQGITTFNVASQNIENTTKYLPNKSSYSQQNNLQVPVKLYSKQAYEASIATCGNEKERALNISQYDVKFTNSDTYYHNRTAISGSTLYEKQPASDSGARPTVNVTDPLNWVWCWFTPE